MKKLLTPILIAIVILLSSCQVSESINMSGGEKTSESDIVVYDFFIDVLNDYSDLMGGSSDSSIMDSAIGDFSASLANNPNNSNIIYQVKGENTYFLSFDFLSISDALSALGSMSSSSIITEDSNSLSFYLDINNYAELKEMIPFLADPNFEVYGPEFNQGMSESDYLDMIFYLLGEDAPDAIKESMISVTITVDGTLSETSGVRTESENTCIFEFPLIDFLLLNNPLSFSISWT